MKDLVRLLRRIAVTVVGAIILAIGVVLLVAPGPGLLVIVLALIVFAIEYEWARRQLVTVRAQALSAADRAAASRVATASAVLFGLGAIGLGSLLIFTDVLPLSGTGTGIGVIVGGVTVLATIGYSLREMHHAGSGSAGQEEGDATPEGSAPGESAPRDAARGGSGPDGSVRGGSAPDGSGRSARGGSAPDLAPAGDAAGNAARAAMSGHGRAAMSVGHVRAEEPLFCDTERRCVM